MTLPQSHNQVFAELLARLIIAVMVGCLLRPQSVDAQILQGDWVVASEQAIEQHRKTDVTVIVLDHNDRTVLGATVKLMQLRHDFVVGITLPADRLPPEGLKELAVYRVFNAIALDRLTDWSFAAAESKLTPQQVALAWQEAVKPAVVSFGRVVSADPARNSDKIALLGPQDLRDAVMARIDFATAFTPAPDTFDLYADLLYQDMIERKLGQGMLHRMFERARVNRPDAQFALRVRDTISLQRGRDLANAIQRLEIRQLPFDRVTIEQRFTGQTQPLALRRMLDGQVATLPVPVSLAEVEVGGQSDVAAGLNMETVLRLVFAQPKIDRIIFAGLQQEGLIEDHAALLDADGKPTASGSMLDQMFNTYWRSNLSLKTDERGNAEARVFTGWYQVSVTLPDGATLEGEAYITKSDRSRLIIMQQTTAEIPQ